MDDTLLLQLYSSLHNPRLEARQRQEDAMPPEAGPACPQKPVRSPRGPVQAGVQAVSRAIQKSGAGSLGRPQPRLGGRHCPCAAAGTSTKLGCTPIRRPPCALPSCTAASCRAPSLRTRRNLLSRSSLDGQLTQPAAPPSAQQLVVRRVLGPGLPPPTGRCQQGRTPLPAPARPAPSPPPSNGRLCGRIRGQAG